MQGNLNLPDKAIIESLLYLSFKDKNAITES